jgi:hypothetical protein
MARRKNRHSRETPKPTLTAGNALLANLAARFQSVDLAAEPTPRPDAMPADPRDQIETEIAASAARLIAEDGLDYASAKRKAADEVLGSKGARRTLPDNAAIEHELRRYLQTFDGDDHRRRLAALRGLALGLMERLADFDPHLVGAVLNGTATTHSDIHLHLFTDNAKDVEVYLMDQGIDFEVEEPGSRRGEAGAPSEELHFVVAGRDDALPPRVGVVLSVHGTDAIRVAPRYRSSAPGLHPVEASGRARAKALRELVEHSERAR